MSYKEQATTMSEPLITLDGITKYFSAGKLQTKALNGIVLQVKRGEFVSVHGPSGCGKSTLLSIVGLLDTPTAGKYSLDGLDTVKLNPQQRAHIRNVDIGIIFQAFNLINDLTVFENVELPLTYQRELSRKERRRSVEALLDEVDMLHRAQLFPMQLSGGQQQRIGIARAVISSPKILLADEPTGNLDSQNAAQVLDIMSRLNRAGTTIIMATHDERSTERASRTVEMLDGKIVDDTSRLQAV
jgi:putative ABC transport system ATP-binding protein